MRPLSPTREGRGAGIKVRHPSPGVGDKRSAEGGLQGVRGTVKHMTSVWNLVKEEGDRT